MKINQPMYYISYKSLLKRTMNNPIFYRISKESIIDLRNIKIVWRSRDGDVKIYTTHCTKISLKTNGNEVYKKLIGILKINNLFYSKSRMFINNINYPIYMTFGEFVVNLKCIRAVNIIDHDTENKRIKLSLECVCSHKDLPEPDKLFCYSCSVVDPPDIAYSYMDELVEMLKKVNLYVQGPANPMESKEKDN